MGIFGGIGKRLKSGDFGDKLLAAGAIVNGDYGTAGQIRAQSARQRAETNEAQAKQEANEMAVRVLVGRGVPENEARVLVSTGAADQVLAQYNKPQEPQADSEFTRTLRAAGIDPASEQGRTLYQQRAATMASPAPQMIGSPETGYRFVTPPSPGLPTQPSPGPAAGGPQPGAVVNGYKFKGGNPNDRGNWEPAGGGAGNGAGTFRFGGLNKRI